MSVVEHACDADADDVLITRVRGGDLDAYGVLFERHRASALRLARSLSNGPDADDLVSDAFAKVLATLQKGGGPDLAFRAYLLTAVRRLHVDRIRAQSRATPTDDIAALDSGEPFSDTAVAAFESGAAARAFRSLPERWQMVLWHLEVEQQKPADIAPMLGMSPNAVAALAYRAREGLRQAFVQMHATDEVPPQCREVRDQLGPCLIEDAKANFDAPLFDHVPEEAEEKPAKKSRSEAPAWSEKPAERREKPGDRRENARARLDTKRDDRFGDKPRGGGRDRDRDDDRFDSKPKREPATRARKRSSMRCRSRPRKRGSAMT